MDFSENYHYLILSLVLLTASGCVKFEDPTLSSSEEFVNHSSPCSIELYDNVAIAFTSSGSELKAYSFLYPSCSGTDLDGNTESGSFEIILSEPITESRTYLLNFPFIEDGEAQIKLSLYDYVGAPSYYSTSGVLYVEVENDGTIIIEWCDIYCKTASTPSSNVLTSGRYVCGL